jgi:SAM-dependent methyltransferase
VNGARLLDWLAALPPLERDRALERWLGIEPQLSAATSEDQPPGPELIGHILSGAAAIVQAAFAAPVERSDHFVDLGSGAGKVALTMHALTGARCQGLEIQPALVERSRAAARRLGLNVTFDVSDARTAELPPATVFYLYLPFTGAALASALERLHVVARHHPIVVCALGLDLRADWLRARSSPSFWLTVYDSGPPRAPRPLTPAAASLVRER